MDTSRRLALKVGVFVALGVAIAFAIVVTLGRERLWFKRKVTFRSAFPEVAGLKEGALVRLGGRDVGIVESIRFADGPGPRGVLVVTYRVQADYARRVREDSVARILTQGLLGDKLLDLTLGSLDAPPVPDGGWVDSVPPADVAELLAAATDAAQRTRDLIGRLDRAVAGVEGAGGIGDAAAALAGVRRIVERIESGPGTLHDLVYGDAVSAQAARTLAAVEDAAGEVDRVLSVIRVDAPAADVLVDSARAARNLAALTGALDADALRRASRDLAEIVANVRAGRGSLGGLIMDPTLYEETKRLLVNIRRNRILSALARYLISRSEDSRVMDARPDAVERIEVRPRPGPRTPAGGRRQ